MSNKGRQRQLLDRDTEKPVLEALYLQEEVPTDQLLRSPEVLRRITIGFNRIASTDHDSSILVRYMINRRKNQDWPRLEDRARRFKSLAEFLSSSELDLLREIYIALDTPLDNYLSNPSLMRTIATRFAGLTARNVKGSILVAVMMAFRKRALWPALRDEFGDISQIVG